MHAIRRRHLELMEVADCRARAKREEACKVSEQKAHRSREQKAHTNWLASEMAQMKSDQEEQAKQWEAEQQRRRKMQQRRRKMGQRRRKMGQARSVHGMSFEFTPNQLLTDHGSQPTSCSLITGAPPITGAHAGLRKLVQARSELTI